MSVIAALIVGVVLILAVALFVVAWKRRGSEEEVPAEVEAVVPDPAPEPIEEPKPKRATVVDPTSLTGQLGQAKKKLSARRPPQPPRTTEPVVAEEPPGDAESRQADAGAPGARSEGEADPSQEKAPERPVRVVRPTGSVIAEGQAAIDWLTERGATGASGPDDDVHGIIVSAVDGIVEVNHEAGVLCFTYNPDPPPATAPQRPETQQRKPAAKAVPRGKKPSNPNDPTDPTSPAFLKWNDPRRLAEEQTSE